MRRRVLFPSQKWFEALARQMIEKSDEFRGFGPVDCTMVVRVNQAEGTQLFELVFDRTV